MYNAVVLVSAESMGPFFLQKLFISYSATQVGVNKIKYECLMSFLATPAMGVLFSGGLCQAVVIFVVLEDTFHF